MSAPRRWRLGIVSDAHLAPPSAEPYTWQNTVDLPRSAELLDAGLGWLREQQIDTLVLLGDLTEAADQESFVAMRERVLEIGVPVLAVPGNCDVDQADRSLTAFEQIADAGLLVAPAHIDDGIELMGLTGAPGSKWLTGVRSPAGRAPSGVHTVLSHYPVLDLEADLTEAGFRHSGNLANRADIEASLRASEAPTVVIHGHLHIHDARISGNLLHLSCGALIEPPHQISTVEVSVQDGSVAVERRAYSVRIDDVERLPVFAPNHGSWIWSDGTWRERHPA